MKKLLFTLLIGISALSYAQAPQKISYQGVARNTSGTVLSNQPIGIKFDIHQGSASGPVVFTETHTGVSTNGFGLFTTYIGSINNLAVINWSTNSYFIEVSIDPNTGTFSSLGSQQLMSVPYALNAGSAPAPTVTFTNNILTVGGNTTTIPAGITYTAGTGINVSGNTISNTAPDQTVVLNATGATTVTGTYPSFTINTPTTQIYSAGNGIDITGGVISNTATAVTPTIIGAGTTTVTSSGNTFTVNTPASPIYTAGNGIDITGGVISNTATAVTPTIVGTGATTVTGTYPNLTINTPTVAPDQAVSLIGTGNATVTGAYPNFTVNVPSGSALPNALNGQFLYHTGTIWDTLPRTNLYFDGTNFGIGTTSPQANFHVVGAGRFDASVSTPQIFTDNIKITGGTNGQVLTSDAVGNGTWQTLVAPTNPTITSTGIAVVTPTTGNTFNVDVPVPVLSYSAGTNVLSLTQGTTVTTATLNGTGSNTVSIVGLGLATVTPTTGSTFTVSVPNPTLSIASGSLSISNGNSVAIPSPSLTINSNSLTINGPGGNTVVLPTSSTTTLTQGSNVTVAGSAPSYTVSAPAYSITLPGGNTVQITNGVSTSTAAIATTSLTLSGTNNNILSAGGNTVALNTYTAGTGIAISGTAPNYTLSSPNQSLTLNSNTLSITGGNTVVLPTSSTTSLTQSTNMIVTGSAPSYTLASVTPTITGTGATTVTGTYPTLTINTPTSQVYTAGSGISIASGSITNTAPDQTVILSGTGATTVTGVYPNYTVSSTSAPTQTLTGTGISSVTSAANTFTVNTPMPTYTQTTGVLSFGGTNTVVATPSLSIVGNIVRSGPATNTITLPTTSITGTGTGIATVTTAATNFTVNVPSPTYTAATGILSFGGTNTVVVTPTLALSGTTLTSGPSTNSVNLSGFNGIYGGSGSIQTGSTTVTVGTNTLTFLSGATMGKSIANFFGGGITGTHLAVGHIGANNAAIKLFGSVSTTPVDYGYVLGSTNGISISGGTSTNGLYATNNAEVGVGSYTTGTGKFVITHTASQADPTMHLRETSGGLNRIKFSNNTVANKFFETAAQTNAVDANGAYSINYYDGTTYKPVVLVTGERKVNINNLNTVLASFHVMENATTAGGGIVSEGFARPGQIIISRNNQPALAARAAIVAADEIGKLSFAGYNGGGFNDGGIISVTSTEAFTGSSGGSNMNFRVTPTGTITTQDIFKLGGDGIVTVNPNNSFTKTLLDVKGRLRVDSSLTMAAYNTPPNTSFGNEGRIYYDRPTNKFKVSENGGVYVDLIPGSGTSPWIQAPGRVTLNNLTDSVGIGTANPTSKLHVYGMADPLQIAVENTGGAFKTGYKIKTASQEWFIGKETGGSNGLRFSDITNGQVRMVIETSGNVGIGTTTPASLLHIVSSPASPSQFILGNVNQPNIEWEWRVDAVSNLSLINEGNGIPFTPFFVENTGKIGIGTTSPSSPLHVIHTSSTSIGSRFESTNSASTFANIASITNGGGAAIQGTSTGTGNAGLFMLNNSSSTSIGLDVSSNASGYTMRSTNTGTGPAGSFEILNAASTQNGLIVQNMGTGAALYASTSNTTSGSAAQFNSNNTNFTTYSTNNGTGGSIFSNGNAGPSLWAVNSSSTSTTIYANNSGTGDVIQAYGTGQRALYAQSASNGYAAVEIENTGTGQVLSAYKSAGATGGVVANFANNSSTNGADAVLVNNSGAGAAIHAVSAATSTVALWVQNGHVKSTGTAPTTSTASVSGGGITGVSASLTNATDIKGKLTAVITTTTLVNPGNNTTIKVTFNKGYSIIPAIVVTPLTDLLGLSYFVTNVTTGSFDLTIKNNSTASITTPGTWTVNFNYMVIE